MNKQLEKIYLIKNKNTGNYVDSNGRDNNSSPCLFTMSHHAKSKIDRNSYKSYSNWRNTEDFIIVELPIKLEF